MTGEPSPSTTTGRTTDGRDTPRRRKLSYELLDCAWHGHVLIGTDAATIRPQDDDVVREIEGLRWHRCLRCDAWLPQTPPVAATRPHPPDREDITLPLRGRPLRDRYVLRLIAVDRALHFVILGGLAAAVFVFAANKALLHRDFVRIVTDLQGGVGGPVHSTAGSAEHELTRLFSISTRNLEITGVALSAYALLEGVEAVGLWLGLRWAEYLTFVATTALVPLEVYEIIDKPTALKAITLVINVAIAVYLIVAKRLFGIRGGGRALDELRAADAGWPAVELATPRPRQAAE
jgi:uncharacterized membrane protein (DUF2068 family)